MPGGKDDEARVRVPLSSGDAVAQVIADSLHVVSLTNESTPSRAPLVLPVR